MTARLLPCRRNSGTNLAAVPCGVQRKRISQSEKAGASGGTTGKLPVLSPCKEGKISSSRRPACEREAAAVISTRGCPASNRNNSPPAYPLTPIIPALTNSFAPCDPYMPNIIYQTGRVGNILIHFL